MLILGTIASSKSTGLSTGYYSIASGVVDSGESLTIDFSTIPDTYKHLQIRISARSTYSYTVDDAFMRFNGDTGNNYSYHNYYGAAPLNSFININQSTTNDKLNWGQAGGIGTSLKGQYGLAVIDILDYASTSKKKSFRSTSGMSTNSAGQSNIGGRVGNATGLWNNTDAINQITIFSASPRNFNENSVFSLYGIV
jgi:hypothetical protein